MITSLWGANPNGFQDFQLCLSDALVSLSVPFTQLHVSGSSPETAIHDGAFGGFTVCLSSAASGGSELDHCQSRQRLHDLLFCLCGFICWPDKKRVSLGAFKSSAWVPSLCLSCPRKWQSLCRRQFFLYELVNSFFSPEGKTQTWQNKFKSALIASRWHIALLLLYLGFRTIRPGDFIRRLWRVGWRRSERHDLAALVSRGLPLSFGASLQPRCHKTQGFPQGRIQTGTGRRFCSCNHESFHKTRKKLAPSLCAFTFCNFRPRLVCNRTGADCSSFRYHRESSRWQICLPGDSTGRSVFVCSDFWALETDRANMAICPLLTALSIALASGFYGFIHLPGSKK